MDNMIRPPRSASRPQPIPTSAAEQPSAVLPPTVEPQPPTGPTPPLPGKRRRYWLWVLIVLAVGIAGIAAAWLTYQALLQPVDSRDDSPQKIVITSGQSLDEIATTLEKRSVIRSAWAFKLMARLSGKHNAIKAGTCSLARNESAEAIIDKLISGCHDFKVITFYPGATLHKSLSKPTSMDVTDILLAAGYSQAEIDTAFAKTYTTRGIDLFEGKPASADLEGYVYGETYYVASDATVEEVLQTAFDQMVADIEAGGYVEKFRAQGLTLYEGITLASIVQRELSCTSGATTCYADQQRIAQVFYSRLDGGMTLGSDVTFYYGADKLGVAPATDLDSPYNTRINTGLPPGPIAAPGEHALDAVANPASTDYLFFIAGDDGNVYYARTNEEHVDNVAKHCQKLCSEL